MRPPSPQPILSATSEAELLAAARTELREALVCDLAKAPCLFAPDSLETIPELLLFAVGVLDAANARAPDRCIEPLCDFAAAVIAQLRFLRLQEGHPSVRLPRPSYAALGEIGPDCPRRTEARVVN